MIVFPTKFMRSNVYKIILFFCAGIFLALVYKDVYSTRTLVPNLEPYPDALYYVGIAKSFVEGKGFVMEREGRSFKPTIPHLYSLVLSPVFLVSSNPLSFYYVNVILSLSSVVLFLLILKRLTASWPIIFLSLFLFVTNYFVYWFVSLAMAENLVMFLFMAALYLFLSEISVLRMCLFGVLITALMATKFVSFPLTGVFFLFYAIKVYRGSKNHRWRKLVLFFACFILPFFAFLFYEAMAKGNNLFNAAVNFVGFLTPVKAIPGAAQVEALSPKHRWYSLENIPYNLDMYSGALVGKQMRFLWDFTPIVPFYIGILALVGLVLGASSKRFRGISLLLILALSSTILYLSTFYSADARYIYFAIPSLLAGLAIFFSVLLERASLTGKRFVYFFLIVVFVLYISSSFIRLKSQVSLNLRYAETPWTYVAILKLREVLKDKDLNKTVVITALPPYLFDFYLKERFIILPLSGAQEFRDRKDAVWGQRDYSDLLGLYKSYVEAGSEVYLEKYGLGNEFYLHKAYNDVASNFDLELVSEGCFDVCNVYRLRLKNGQGR